MRFFSGESFTREASASRESHEEAHAGQETTSSKLLRVLEWSLHRRARERPSLEPHPLKLDQHRQRRRWCHHCRRWCRSRCDPTEILVSVLLPYPLALTMPTTVSSVDRGIVVTPIDFARQQLEKRLVWGNPPPWKAYTPSKIRVDHSKVRPIRRSLTTPVRITRRSLTTPVRTTR